MTATTHCATRLLDMTHSRRRGCRTFARERLRIEMSYGQRLLDIVFAGDLANLLRRHFAQLLKLQVDRTVRNANGLERADLTSLVHHRIPLVDVSRDRLGFRALQFLLRYAVRDDLLHLAPQPHFDL